MNGIGQLQGALHLHTNLSHDGTLSLEQLADFLKGKGFQFIAITEHSYDINESSMADLANRCAHLSTSDFLIIPGIEFRCHDDIDILGYGVVKTCTSDDPATIIKHIQSNGGAAVLAHPTVRNYPFDSNWIRMLDGCEIWNRQERKYLPQYRSVGMFSRFKKWHPELKAFCGLDLHSPANFYHISTIVSSPRNSAEDLLLSLKNGNFYSKSRIFSVNSNGKLNIYKILFIYCGGSIINLIRYIRDYVNR